MFSLSTWGRRAAAVLAVAMLGACSDGGGGTDPVPPAAAAPVFTAQPSDAQVVAGGEARFSASARGTAMTWGWQRSNDNGTTWVPLTIGGTVSADNGTAFLTLPALTTSDNNARFRAVASSSGQQALSSAATLTVTERVVAPAITVQARPQNVFVGASATFAITAVGTNLAYQWQSGRDGVSWADVAAATTPTLTLASVSDTLDGTLYRVLVRNSAGSVTSDTVALTVTSPPAAPGFTQQPLAAAVVAPATATFSVGVSGQPTPAVQWQRSTNGGVSFVDIPGATGTSYTTPATTLTDNGVQHRAVATSSAGTATSLAATLSVSAAQSRPEFTAQPADASVAVGQTATWTVAVAGVPTPSLQWQLSTDGGLSFANINGATGNSYSLVAALPDNGKQHRVVASNSQGTTVSRAASLTVAAPTSVLSGRNWLAGARVNTLGDFVIEQPGFLPQAVIDKAGRVHALYATVSAGGPWEVVVATSLPGDVGAQPVHSPPVVLASGPQLTIGTTRTAPFVPDGLWLAANGNTVATWKQATPCAADPDAVCLRSWQATYNAATRAWGAANLATDQELALLKGIFNDVGDRIAMVPSSSGASPLLLLDLGWRQRDRSNVETVSLAAPSPVVDVFTLLAKLSLDNNGDFVLVSVKAGSNFAANLVARRGSIRTGVLGPEELLESRDSPATINGFWSNSAGQVVVMWYQDSGTRVTQYASTLDSSTGSWVRTELGPYSATDVYALGAVTSSGDFHAYSRSTCRTLRRVNGSWVNPTALPSALCGSSIFWAMDNNANLLAINGVDGRWASFDARSQTLVQSFVNATPTTGAGFVLGTRWNSLPGTALLLSDTGIGAFVSVNSFSALPTPATPNGDSTGTSMKNIWNIYFK